MVRSRVGSLCPGSAMVNHRRAHHRRSLWTAPIWATPEEAATFQQLTIYINMPYSLSCYTLFFYAKIMTHVNYTKLSEGRRVAIPAELCQRYGLQPGAPVVLEPAEGGIVIRPLEARSSVRSNLSSLASIQRKGCCRTS